MIAEQNLKFCSRAYTNNTPVLEEIMKFICGKDYQEMSNRAANLIMAQVLIKSDSVLGLATGSSPVGTYKKLIDYYNKGELDFSNIVSVNLDEYKGLEPTHEQSYRYFMQTNFFNSINIKKENTNVPNGLEKDSEKACSEYNRIIDEVGGIDLQLLGLGHNGHIGFNEPADTFVKKTHCVDLTDMTIDANTRFFASREDVPTQAYTMGIQNIMLAKKIVVVVSGRDKAEIVKKAFTGEITPRVPASVLQLHQDCTIVGDEAAFSLL